MSLHSLFSLVLLEQLIPLVVPWNAQPLSLRRLEELSPALLSAAYAVATGAVDGTCAPSSAYFAKSCPHGDSTSQRS